MCNYFAQEGENSLANLDLTGSNPVQISESSDYTEKAQKYMSYMFKVGKRIQIAV